MSVVQDVLLGARQDGAGTLEGAAQEVGRTICLCVTGLKGASGMKLSRDVEVT